MSKKQKISCSSSPSRNQRNLYSNLDSSLNQRTLKPYSHLDFKQNGLTLSLNQRTFQTLEPCLEPSFQNPSSIISPSFIIFYHRRPHYTGNFKLFFQIVVSHSESSFQNLPCFFPRKYVFFSFYLCIYLFSSFVTNL